MNSYYEERLYPLQDKILAAFERAQTPFYLTGGTALSRFHYAYRYSDDLDFFVNSFAAFTSEVDRLTALLSDFRIKVAIRTDTYCSLTAEDLLKVEFVNDAGQYPKTFLKAPMYSKVDLPERILANKLSALLSRDEPKDVVDMWIIATHTDVHWKELFSDISSRAAGIFPPLVAEKISAFPVGLLENIKWVEHNKPDFARVQYDLEKMAHDMLVP